MRMRRKMRLVAELALASALTAVTISNIQVTKPASHRVFAATIAKDSSGVTEWHEWGNNSNPVDWGIDKNGTLWLRGNTQLDIMDERLGYTGDTSGSIGGDDQNTIVQNVTTPWHQYKDSITSVRVDNDSIISVTSAKYLFADLPNCVDIDLSRFDFGSGLDSFQSMFVNDTGLTTITGLDKLFTSKLSKYGWSFNSKITDMRFMFENCKSLTNIDLSNWDVSNVTTMERMVRNCSNLVSVGNLDKWNVSNLQNALALFGGDYSLTTVGDLSNWDVKNVRNAGWMFGSCPKLSGINISSWHLDNVYTTEAMFYKGKSLSNSDISGITIGSSNTSLRYTFVDCINLTNFDASNIQTDNVKSMDSTFAISNDNLSSKLTAIKGLSKWNTSSVTSMLSLFARQGALSSVGDLSKWDTSKVTNMEWMFYKCQSLTTPGNLNNWNVGNVKAMGWMFFDCQKLASIGDLSKWNVGNVTDTSGMFKQCFALTSLGDLSNWDVGSDKQMQGMFNNCQSLSTLGNLSNWNVSNVTDMNDMFQNCKSITSIGDLSKWNVKEVTRMGGMFQGCSKLTSLGNLSNWDIENVQTTTAMFEDCTSLTKIGDLSKWNTSKITTMAWMFNSCKNLSTIGKLDKWDTSKVTTMHMMFNDCNSLSTLGDLSNWDVSKVTTMHRMFYRCNNLKSVGKLDNWDISNVTNIRGMFTYDSKLTTVGDLSKWNTSKVNNMGWLFYCCPGLTTVGDLSKWDVSNVTEMDYMFSDCTQMNNIGDISKWNTAKVTTMNHMFYNTLALIDIDISGFSGTSLINTNSMFAYSGAKSIKMGNLSNTSVSADSSTEMFSHCSNLKSVTLGPNWSFKTTESSLDSATTSNSNILPDDTTYYGKWESSDGKKSFPSAKAFAKAWTSSMAGTWNYTTDWTTEGQNVSKTKADGDTDITHQAGTYLVTVPTKITFTGMPVGKVNQDISYSVNVRGNLATGKYIHLATKTALGNLSSSGIGLSFNQGKTVWSKENAYGTVNPDGSNMGTNSTDSVSLTGEVKSVGKYTGLITYESSMTDTAN